MAEMAPNQAAILAMIVCILGLIWIAHRLDCRARRRNAARRAERARRAAQLQQVIARRTDPSPLPGEAAAEHLARLARLRLPRAQSALHEDPMRRHTSSPCVIAPASMAEPPRPITIGDTTDHARPRRTPASTTTAIEE